MQKILQLTCNQSSQHSLFISGQTCSSIDIIFSANNRSFLPLCFPLSLESTTGFSSSINHAVISPILPHPVLWMALPPLVPSITPHSFIPGLKRFFSANPFHHSLPFLLHDWIHVFPRLFTDTLSLSVFYFLFLFSHFLVFFGSVQWIKLTCQLLSALWKASHSYRIIAYSSELARPILISALLPMKLLAL